VLFGDVGVGYFWNTSWDTNVVEPRGSYGNAMEYSCRHMVFRNFGKQGVFCYRRYYKFSLILLESS
jgi:hypothetical protein